MMFITDLGKPFVGLNKNENSTEIAQAVIASETIAYRSNRLVWHARFERQMKNKKQLLNEHKL